MLGFLRRAHEADLRYTVRDGETGVLFHEVTTESLEAALRAVQQRSWDAARLRLHAESFSVRTDREARVLHAAGKLSSPLDSGSLMSYGKPGPGKHITIYANPGHMFMTINGRRFDTGYGGNGNRWASGSRPTAGYTVRHPPGL